VCISKETCEKEMEIKRYYAGIQCYYAYIYIYWTLLWRCSYRHVYTKRGVRDGGARERREIQKIERRGGRDMGWLRIVGSLKL